LGNERAVQREEVGKLRVTDPWQRSVTGANSIPAGLRSQRSSLLV
jgi:hypothetical protein